MIWGIFGGRRKVLKPLKRFIFFNIVHQNPTKHLCESSLHSTDYKFRLMLSPQFSRSSEWWPGCGLFPAAGAQSGVDWRVLNGVSTRPHSSAWVSSPLLSRMKQKTKSWPKIKSESAQELLLPAHTCDRQDISMQSVGYTQAQFENSVKSFLLARVSTNSSCLNTFSCSSCWESGSPSQELLFSARTGWSAHSGCSSVSGSCSRRLQRSSTQITLLAFHNAQFLLLKCKNTDSVHNINTLHL